MFPDLDIRKDVLFVHDGNTITSAGGAKSFEAALYLCEYLYGPDITKSLAGGLGNRLGFWKKFLILF